jgi:hypothetical protein
LYAGGLNEIATMQQRLAQMPSPFKTANEKNQLPTVSPAGRAAIDAELKAAEERRQANEAYAKSLDAVNRKIAEASRPIRALTDAQERLVNQYRALGLSNQDIATKLNISTRSVDAFTNELDDTSASMAANRSETSRLTEAVGKTDLGYLNFKKTLTTTRSELALTAEQAAEFDPGRAFLAASNPLEKFNKHLLSLKDIGGQASGVVDEIRAAMDRDAESFEKASFHLDDFASSLAQLAQISGGTFGGLLQDIGKIAAGLDLANKAADHLALGGLKNIAGGLLEGATAIAAATSTGNKGLNVAGGAAAGFQVGAATPLGPIGGAIGAGVGALVGLFRGGGEIKQVNALRDAFIEAAGGLHALNAHAHDAGTSLKQFLQAKTVDEFNAAVQGLEQAFNDLDAAAQRYGLTSKDLHDKNRRLDEGKKVVNDLVDTFNKLTRAGFDSNTVLSRMGGDFRTALSEMADSGVLEDFLGQLVDLGRISQETADTLLNIGPSVDYDALTKKAADYGITLQQLGPQFQQANVSSTANELLNLFTELTRAGGDAGGIMNGLADEVSALLQNATTFGSAIPNAMKPMIEQMVAAGLVTDAAGNKIDDLSGVTFADSPLEEGLDNLNSAIRDLIDALSGKLPSALTNLRNFPVPDLHVPVILDIPDLPDIRIGAEGAASGGFVTADGIQHFGGGGVVLPFRRRGTDTVPAMLTPGEMILNAAQQRNLAGALGGGGTTNVYVSVSANGDFTSIASEQRMAQRIGKAVVSDLNRAFKRGA